MAAMVVEGSGAEPSLAVSVGLAPPPVTVLPVLAERAEKTDCDVGSEEVVAWLVEDAKGRSGVVDGLGATGVLIEDIVESSVDKTSASLPI
jgi:hypothetical protein